MKSIPPFFSSKASLQMIQILGICLCLFTCVSCSCDDPSDPECRNYDPCFARKAADADFYMYELIVGDTVEIRTEKMLYTRTLLLSAKQETDVIEYSWKIGSDTTIRRGKDVIVTFGLPYDNIPITLAVKKVAYPNCFPDDNGKDTLTKVVKLVDKYEMPILGLYEGFYEDSPGDYFEVEVRLDSIYNGGLQEQFNMYNLPKGCPKMQQLRMGANGFLYPSSGGVDGNCLNAWGKGELLSQDSISIFINVSEHNEERNNNLSIRKFIGKRK